MNPEGIAGDEGGSNDEEGNVGAEGESNDEEIAGAESESNEEGIAVEKGVQTPQRQGPVMWTFKRPALLWVFTLYFLYSTIFEVSRTYGIWAGNFGVELQASYDGLTWVDWTMWGAMIVLTLTLAMRR